MLKFNDFDYGRLVWNVYLEAGTWIQDTFISSA